MSAVRVTVARLRCDHRDDQGRRCDAVLHMDAALYDDQVRAAGRERGWAADETGRDCCPRHREATT